MEKKDKNSAVEDTSTDSTVQRGQKAIEAEEKINKKDPEDPAVKAEKKKDAEQWRNEG